MTNTEAIEVLQFNTEFVDAEFEDALNLAISALEKQEIDKCCETCRHKYGSQQEPPCCDCYLATAYEDCYEAEEES